MTPLVASKVRSAGVKVPLVDCKPPLDGRYDLEGWVLPKPEVRDDVVQRDKEEYDRIKVSTPRKPTKAMLCWLVSN